jgi:phosphomannomutase
MSADIARQHGVEFYLAPVGEANVTDVMLSTGAVFGGEGNGGPIDPRVGYVRDSFVGMALILDAMAARDLPVSTLADALPRYAIRKTKCEVPGDRLAGVLEALQVRFPEARVNRMDGLRLDWPGRWLLVRGSNTEPIVRVIAEAETRQVAEELCEAAGETIRLAVGPT